MSCKYCMDTGMCLECDLDLRERIRELEERLKRRPKNNASARCWHECLMKAEDMIYEMRKERDHYQELYDALADYGPSVSTNSDEKKVSD